MKRLFLVGAMLLYCVALSAQTSDAEPQKPVRPVRTIESVSVIDTLPSGNDDLSVVLYSDNTDRKSVV